MPAYLIADTTSILDPELMNEYIDLAGPTVAAHGGKVLAGGAATALEGNWAPTEMIMIEFESAEKLQTWYKSAEYQAVLPKRLKASVSNIIVLGD